MSTRKHPGKPRHGSTRLFQHHQEAQVRHLQFPGWLSFYHFCTERLTPALISKAAASSLVQHATLTLISQLFLSHGVSEELTSITKALWVKPSVHLGGLVAMASVAVGDRGPSLQWHHKKKQRKFQIHLKISMQVSTAALGSRRKTEIHCVTLEKPLLMDFHVYSLIL